MCNFTPYLFPNCHCTQIDTGALELCSAATRTGEKCHKPHRELLQKRTRTCCHCKQAQVAKDKAKAEAESKLAQARAGREDSLVDGASGASENPATDKITDAQPVRSASRSNARGKGRRSGRTSASGKGAGEAEGRSLRSGSKTTTLPTR